VGGITWVVPSGRSPRRWPHPVGGQVRQGQSPSSSGLGDHSFDSRSPRVSNPARQGSWRDANPRGGSVVGDAQNWDKGPGERVPLGQNLGWNFQRVVGVNPRSAKLCVRFATWGSPRVTYFLDWRTKNTDRQTDKDGPVSCSSLTLEHEEHLKFFCVSRTRRFNTANTKTCNWT
jgi:hypothetical protein